MFPYEKQNLVPYRWLLGLWIFAVLSFSGLGILFQKHTGLVFIVVAVGCACVFLRAAFAWHSEPTAKRQFVTGGLVMLVFAVAGAMAIEALLIGYHLHRDECLIWMDFSGLCRLSPN
ncbi:hypothetical protein [Brevundimonas sp.]|uniref:hypothetical protein n=1 Tax=Brevundimonas sp. TaxID=1871086 RepID=UPI003A8F58AB